MAARTNTWGTVTRDSGFRSRQDGTLKWWIMLALILSFGFHAVLIFLFETLEVSPSPLTEEKPIPQRLKIDPKLLQQQEAIRDVPKDIAPVDKPDVEMFKPDLDTFDKLNSLPKNQEIDLTPSVKDIQNLVRQSPDQKIGNTMANSLASMLAATPAAGPSEADVASAMAAVKSSVLSKPLSSKQMVLDSNPLAKGDEKIGQELLESLGDGKAKNASNTKVKGFSNLDDLLSGGGQVGGSTAPILMPTDLLFDFGSDVLADGARLSLMKLGFLIQKNPDSLFIIEGHTDTIGSDESNTALSQRRANAVVEWLMHSLRLTPDRIRAVGMGRSRPLVNPYGTKEQQGMNRRVEIKVRPRH
ncbi:MAG: outer membrane protein OmpA [Verrucomicrobiaceae bacterium]|nr:outer membrane protein OmpA [Verrucomicrobiaceae bacterium]